MSGTPFTLTAMPATVVRFDGLPSREGPLTLGQLNILRWITTAPESFDTTLGNQLALPDGVRVTDVVETLETLLARHEGLRTTFALGDPPRQQVLARGCLELETYEIGPVAPTVAQRVAVADELAERWRPGAACGPGQLPVWLALAVRSGQVYACHVRFSHLVADEQAVTVLRHEFAELLDDRATRAPGGPRHQPLDQAAREDAPRLRTRVDRALRHREKLLRQMPVSPYPVPRHDPVDGSIAVDMRSRAAALALRRLAARTGRSRPSAVLAAVCALLSHHTGQSRLVFPTLASNRFDAELHDHVGTLVQTAFARIDVDPVSFDSLVRRAWLAVVGASERGMYDVIRSGEIDERVGLERGVHFTFEPLFNSPVVDAPDDREPPGPGLVVDALPETTLTRLAMRRTLTAVRFDLYDYHDVVHLRLWSGDAGRISGDAAQTLLLALEQLLVAASWGDLDQPAMARALSLAGVAPLAEGPDWLRLDSCWVELPEVQRLLDDAFAPARAQIFPAVDGRELVAYVAVSESVRTPEQAHARCVAALPGRHTAMAPRHYVLCEAAPDDPTDAASWGPVRRQGSGRPGTAAPAAGLLLDQSN